MTELNQRASAAVEGIESDGGPHTLTARHRGFGQRHRTVLRRANAFGLVFVWIASIGVFWGLIGRNFASVSNFQTIFSLQAALVIVSLALVCPLAAGEFDLSVGGGLSLGFTLTAALNINHHWPLGAALVVVFASGIVVGLINAVLCVFLGLDSIVVTLGTGTILMGLGYLFLTNPVTGISSGFVNFSNYRLLGITTTFWIALFLTLIMGFAFRFTATGRYVYFVGEGRDAAKLAGINVNRVRTGVLVVSATMSCGAGILLAGSTGGADPTTAAQYLLAAFAAVFLGGTAIVPGRFNPWGTLIAVYFLATGVDGLQLLGQSGWVTQVFYGGALVLGVIAARLSRLVGKKESAVP
jgi:ribose transport system permease protein